MAEKQGKEAGGLLEAAGFGTLAGCMLVYPAEAAEAARQGLMLWARNIVPVLGPFMVCMLMLLSRISIGGNALRVGLAWLCGSPGGARMMQGQGLNGKSALRMAAMTGTMSPMFFLGTLAAWVKIPKAGAVMLFCHLGGALALGLCLPGKMSKEKKPLSPMPLAVALRESELALLTIALCMMIGSAAAKMAACALPWLPKEGACALQCLLEITAGARKLIALHPPCLVPLLSGACSFGGLSLLWQNGAFWQESGVKIGQLLILRLLHGLLSGGLCFLIWESIR